MASGDSFLFEKNDLPLQAFPAMEDIRKMGKLCDVTLRVDEHKFTAHRIVLAATIPYFHAMFTHDMMEAKQNEITIQGIEPCALESLINFAYSGKLQMDITNVQSLLVGSSFLHLQVVKDACCDFLKLRLHPNNVLGIRSFAEQFACSSLVEASDKYIQKYFSDVAMSEEFMQLSVEEVTDLLTRDELNVSSEEEVFEGMVSWIKFEHGRCEHTSDLLVKVRLPLLTPQYLSDRVATEELIKTSLKCRDLLDEAKDYHLMPERRPLLQTFKARRRYCTGTAGTIFAVGGLTSAGQSLSAVESFDSLRQRWQVSEPMMTLRSRVGVSVLNGRLFAIGGYDGQERLSTVEVFDPVSKSWDMVHPMNCRRSALGATGVDGQLYVCGGYDGVESLDSVECYDPNCDSWTLLPHMLEHRSAAGVTQLDSQVYVLGGHNGLSIFNSVETFNKTTNEWSLVACMLAKRCRLGVATLGGRVYAAGGYDGSQFLKTVECYDSVSREWRYLAPMNVRRSRVALVADAGKLYAIGGYDGVQNLNTVEVYDVDADVWAFAQSMIDHEGGVGAAVIPDVQL